MDKNITNTLPFCTLPAPIRLPCRPVVALAIVHSCRYRCACYQTKQPRVQRLDIIDLLERFYFFHPTSFFCACKLFASPTVVQHRHGCSGWRMQQCQRQLCVRGAEVFFLPLPALCQPRLVLACVDTCAGACRTRLHPIWCYAIPFNVQVIRAGRVWAMVAERIFCVCRRQTTSMRSLFSAFDSRERRKRCCSPKGIVLAPSLPTRVHQC